MNKYEVLLGPSVRRIVEADGFEVDIHDSAVVQFYRNMEDGDLEPIASYRNWTEIVMVTE